MLLKIIEIPKRLLGVHRPYPFGFMVQKYYEGYLKACVASKVMLLPLMSVETLLEERHVKQVLRIFSAPEPQARKVIKRSHSAWCASSNSKVELAAREVRRKVR